MEAIFLLVGIFTTFNSLSADVKREEIEIEVVGQYMLDLKSPLAINHPERQYEPEDKHTP